ncbi:hypothetical protein K3495_g3437 [Podosphaera aphanis]|nr:hypothetical protein K3495_g3437 [Podosphaera aphanis]
MKILYTKRLYLQHRTSPSRSSNSKPQRNDRNVRFESPKLFNRGRAYTAYDLDVDEEEYEATLGTDHKEDDIIEEGNMAFSPKSAISKQKLSLSPATWHPDTAASSHMTDQRQFFKRLLHPTRRK